MVRALVALMVVAMLGITGYYTVHHVGCPFSSNDASVKSPCCEQLTTPSCCTESTTACDAPCTGECPGASGKCCQEKETKETKETTVAPK